MTPEDEEKNRKLREQLRRSFQRFGSTAEARAAFTWSRSAMTSVTRAFCPTAEVLNLGPDALTDDLFDLNRVGVVTELGDDRWAAIIKVDTDAERDQLKGDDTFLETLMQSAKEAGFAPYEIQIESQETVDRHYNGSWHLRWRA
jgi:hypothetical protein